MLQKFYAPPLVVALPTPAPPPDNAGRKGDAAGLLLG